MHTMRRSRHFGTKNYALKRDIVQNLGEFCQLLLCDFLAQNVPILSDRNFSMTLDQNMSIILVRNIYNGNI